MSFLISDFDVWCRVSDGPSSGAGFWQKSSAEKSMKTMSPSSRFPVV
jgi:hypothetical protein